MLSQYRVMLKDRGDVFKPKTNHLCSLVIESMKICSTYIHVPDSYTFLFMLEGVVVCTAGFSLIAVCVLTSLSVVCIALVLLLYILMIN